MNSNELIDKIKTNKGDEIIVVRRTRDMDYWYCGYVKCTTQITVDPEFPRQGYSDMGEVMLFNQPDLELEGWYYFWDTAHFGLENTKEELVSMVLSDLYDSNEENQEKEEVNEH